MEMNKHVSFLKIILGFYFILVQNIIEKKFSTTIIAYYFMHASYVAYNLSYMRVYNQPYVIYLARSLSTPKQGDWGVKVLDLVSLIEIL